MTELGAWLGAGGFEGRCCSLEELESTVRQIALEWTEDLLLFLALPERLAAAKDPIVKAVNQRKGHTVCILLTFVEGSASAESGAAKVSPDFLSDVKLNVDDKRSFNRLDKWQAKAMLSYRRSKAEFGFLVVSNLGNLLKHWKNIQSTSNCQDLSAFLQEAGREHLKDSFEISVLTGLNSLVVLFPTLCEKCQTIEAAVQAGHLACLQQLFEDAPDGPQSLESRDLTPLHLAVLNAGQKKQQVEIYEKIAKFLLLAKHDPACQNSRGITPLHWAAGYGRASLVSAMLHMIGTGDLTREATDMNYYSAEELAKMKSLANLQDRHGRTALYRAVMHCHEEVVQWLLRMRSDCNVADCNVADHRNYTPLHVAMQQNPRERLVRLLLEGSARIDLPNEDGRLPLHFLAGVHRNLQDEQMKILELLKPRPEFLAGVAARDDDGWTPLHEAALAGNAKALRWLLDCGDAMELVTKTTPKVLGVLHVAVMGKDVECAKLLVEFKASPLEPCCLTWDDEHFKVRHHHVQVGLCLMNSGILALPFERIVFKSDLRKSEFHRNVSQKLKELQRDPRRSELKVLNSKDLGPDHCEIIFAEARRLDMKCVSPGEYKEDGSRRPLIVYKDLEPMLHSRRVLEDIEFRQRVRSRLEELDPGHPVVGLFGGAAIEVSIGSDKMEQMRFGQSERFLVLKGPKRFV